MVALSRDVRLINSLLVDHPSYETSLSYNPAHIYDESQTHTVWAVPCSLAATGGMDSLSSLSNHLMLSIEHQVTRKEKREIRFLFLWLLRGFTSPGTLPAPIYVAGSSAITQMGFPHSDIHGSKLAWQLPVTYRSYATSFVAFLCLGIHHTPLRFLFKFLLVSKNRIEKTARIIAYLPIGL